MSKPAPQLSLFSGPTQHQPASTFREHETSIINTPDGPVVRVRLRITGEHIDSRMSEGPLTFGECLAWEEPCALTKCRHRLDDDQERRTRRVSRVSEPEDRYGNDIDTVYGPRFPNGGLYRDSVMGPGDWCALRVALDYEDRGAPLSVLASIFGTTKETASKALVEPAIAAAGLADHALDDVFEGHYGDAGRIHKFKFKAPDDNITSTEVDRLVVPGEEPCTCKKCQCADTQAAKGEVCGTCSLRVKAPGKVCGTCGLRVKRGRQALTVGRRRKRGDQWDGVVRVVPAEWADKVDVRLMNPLSVPDKIPARFSDMGEMLKARQAARKASAE